MEEVDKNTQVEESEELNIERNDENINKIILNVKRSSNIINKETQLKEPKFQLISIDDPASGFSKFIKFILSSIFIDLSDIQYDISLLDDDTIIVQIQTKELDPLYDLIFSSESDNLDLHTLQAVKIADRKDNELYNNFILDTFLNKSKDNVLDLIEQCNFKIYIKVIDFENIFPVNSIDIEISEPEVSTEITKEN